MAFTGHGHQIPGSPVSGIAPKQVSRCGGIYICESCSKDAARYIHPSNYKERNGITMIKTEKFVRKPFTIDAVKVTSENIEEVAEWAMGEIRLTEKGDPYVHVRVHRPLTSRQTKAFVGDWVLYANKGFKVYTDKAFQANFESVFKSEDNESVKPGPSSEKPKFRVVEKDESTPVEELVEGTKDTFPTPADVFKGDA